MLDKGRRASVSSSQQEQDSCSVVAVLQSRVVGGLETIHGKERLRPNLISTFRRSFTDTHFRKIHITHLALGGRGKYWVKVHNITVVKKWSIFHCFQNETWKGAQQCKRWCECPRVSTSLKFRTGQQSPPTSCPWKEEQ